MNRVKSIFILVYPVIVVGIATAALVMLFVRDADVAWLGALVSVLPFIGLYIRAVTARKLARTSHRLPVLSAITLAGGGLALYGFVQSDGASWLPLVAALLGTAGFFLFDFWYSSFGRRVSDRLIIGRPLPDFEVEDTDGRRVPSSEFLGRPTLFMFYRGNWCPFCMGQVREVAEQYKALSERGVEVALISPQPTALTERVAQIFDIPYRFLVDRDLEAARALGIAHEYGVPAGPLARRYGRDTVLPTVIITDPEGVILFTEQTENYRVRPDPGIFLRALANHGY
jgi:peroxiredoxin